VEQDTLRLVDSELATAMPAHQIPLAIFTPPWSATKHFLTAKDKTHWPLFCFAQSEHSSPLRSRHF
jgi:hypothetical protein